MRVSTSSETMVIRFSSVSTLTRIDLLATADSASSLSGAASALRACQARACDAAGAAGTGPGVSRNTRSSSSSDTSPGRSSRSSVCGTSVPTVCSTGAGVPLTLLHHLLELVDQIGVGAFWLALVLFKLGENVLDAVDGEQDERDGLAGDRHAVAEFAHQGFGRVRQRFQARQAEESAGALDGVDQPEDVAENFGVVGLLLETHELDVDHVEAFVGFDQELSQQVVHAAALARGNAGRRGQFRPGRLSVALRRLISVAVEPHSSSLTAP